MSPALRDIRFAARYLRRRPLFTIVAAGTLALGIGATTALFSVVHAVLISPYPYASPDEIWAPGVQSASNTQRLRPFRLAAIDGIASLPAAAVVMATAPGGALLTGDAAPENVSAIRVTGNAFAFLGVPPLLGRTLQPSDVASDGTARPVAVISFRRWQQQFGGSPDVLGRTLRLDDEDHAIVGVMPPRFGWWTNDGVWLPLGRTDPDLRAFPIVRLADGASIAAARTQLDGLLQQVAAGQRADYPPDAFKATLTNYMDITVASGQMRRSLQLLFASVVLLLLIACANVANLQLARASSRTRELAVRMSLGAHRGQILRQLMVESSMLASLGGIAGIACAYAIIQVMVALMPSFFVPNEARIELNGTALLFSVGVTVVTGLLFGLVPALRTSRPQLAASLGDESRGTTASAGGRMRNSLVVAEVALSVVLLVLAVATVRSFVTLQQTDLGFSADDVVAVGLPLAPARYGTLDDRNRFALDLVRRVEALPGVEAVTVGNGGLPFGGPESPFAIDGRIDADVTRVRLVLASAGYLDVLHIPLRRGRMFDEADVTRGRRVAVINEAAAKLWPEGVDPIGRTVRVDLLGSSPSATVLVPDGADPVVTVVGVSADARIDGLQAELPPVVIVPFTLVAPPQRTLAVRTATAVAPLTNALRTQVMQLDPVQPLAAPYLLSESVAAETLQPRFTMALFALFAVLGLVLAMAGLYSVLAYLVSMRTREIGIRMALGALPGDIQRLVGGVGGRLVAIGLVVGLLVTAGVARLLASQFEVFGGATLDLVSVSVVCVVVAGCAVLACVVPARLAAAVAPTDAMR